MWLPTKRLVAYLCQPGNAREMGGREGGRETNTDTDTDTDTRKKTHHRHKHRGKRKLSAFIGIGLVFYHKNSIKKKKRCTIEQRNCTFVRSSFTVKYKKMLVDGRGNVLDVAAWTPYRLRRSFVQVRLRFLTG